MYKNQTSRLLLLPEQQLFQHTQCCNNSGLKSNRKKYYSLLLLIQKGCEISGLITVLSVPQDQNVMCTCTS